MVLTMVKTMVMTTVIAIVVAMVMTMVMIHPPLDKAILIQKADLDIDAQSEIRSKI